MQFICQIKTLFVLVKRADIYRNLNIAYKKCKKKPLRKVAAFSILQVRLYIGEIRTLTYKLKILDKLQLLSQNYLNQHIALHLLL